MWTLPAGHGLNDGYTMIGAGSTLALADGTEITCTGTADCTLTVSTDPVTGASSASSTGGVVSVTTEATRMAAEVEMKRLAREADMKTLSDAQAELTRVQALYDAGDATANQLAAAMQAVTDAEMLPGNQPPPEPPPMVVAASGEVAVTGSRQLELLFALPNPGDSDTIEIEAGQTVYRQGVGFTCNSDYACTVTLTNNVDTIVATWSSQTLGDGTADVALSYASGGIMAPGEGNLNTRNVGSDLVGWALPLPGQGWTRSIPAGATRTIGQGRFTCPADGPDCRVNIRNHFGTYSVWWSRAMPTVAWLPLPEPPRDPIVVGGTDRANPATVHGAITQAGNIVTLTDFAAADVATGGTPPTARVAATVNDLKHPGTFELQGDFVEFQVEPTPPAADPDPVIPSSSTDDAGGPVINADGLAIDPTGWRVHALERDWAHRLPDDPEDAPLYGGFETNALIAENIEGNKTRQFDELFTLNTDGELVGLTGDPTENAGYAVFDYDGASGTYQNRKDPNEDWRGSFANVPGVYRCQAECWLVKDREKGTVSVVTDDGGTPSGPTETAVVLEFVPDDPEAMASVADWAYQTFGVWLTTPENSAGQHSIGQMLAIA